MKNSVLPIAVGFLFIMPFFNNETAFATPQQDSATVIRYHDYIYKKSIKTVQLISPDFELSQPFIHLNTNESLLLAFDDISGDFQDYSYTFIHCNANWEPSDMMSSEFIDGFADNSITDYSYSNNTLQKYIHYKTIFPNNSTRFIKSGNYLLKVYQDGDPEDIVITKRFMISDNKISITGSVNSASITTDRNYKQEIDFIIDYQGYSINNPYSDLKVYLQKNNQWTNMKSGLKPVYVRDQQLVYDYDEENVFYGGNEFRNFDIKSIRYNSPRVASIKRHDDGFHVSLFADEKRTFKQYFNQPDINGNFIIKNEDGRTTSETDGEYCFVSFYLPYEHLITEGKVYVFGAFNGWNCTEENKMRYNIDRMGYEAKIYLKQGYYNYEYVLNNDKNEVNEVEIEGSHSETENDYSILVYHRFPGTFYDQLIGVKRLNSMKH